VIVDCRLKRGLNKVVDKESAPNEAAGRTSRKRAGQWQTKARLSATRSLIQGGLIEGDNEAQCCGIAGGRHCRVTGMLQLSEVSADIFCSITTSLGRQSVWL
jgi:hypothetical protein